MRLCKGFTLYNTGSYDHLFDQVTKLLGSIPSFAEIPILNSMVSVIYNALWIFLSALFAVWGVFVSQMPHREFIQKSKNEIPSTVSFPGISHQIKIPTFFALLIRLTTARSVGHVLWIKGMITKGLHMHDEGNNIIKNKRGSLMKCICMKGPKAITRWLRGQMHDKGSYKWGPEGMRLRE